MSTSGALTVAVLALVMPAAASDQNVALDRPYTCSVGVLPGWTGLVDGVIDSDAGPGCFATVNDPQFPKYVTIDLQRPCIINRVAVHNSANGNTRHITIAISTNGRDYEQLREFIFSDREALTLNHRFGNRRAQFVRIGLLDSWTGGLGGDHCVFLREVEVFGAPTGEPGVRPPLAEPMGDPLLRTRELRLFRHYALDAERDVKILVLGDSLAAGAQAGWPEQLVQLLSPLRPLGFQTEVDTVCHIGLDPASALGEPLDAVVAAAPDLCLLTLGTDCDGLVSATLRRDLTELVTRLCAELPGLVVLVGPVPDPENTKTLQAVRQIALEMEQLAQVLHLPMLRTERALLLAGVEVWQRPPGPGNEPPSLTDDARRTIAERLVELLTQP